MQLPSPSSDALLSSLLEQRALANRRAEFLSEASTVLFSSLDYRQTLERLARLSVQIMGDWCTVTQFREKDGRLERLASIHADPSKAPLLEELAQYLPVEPDGSKGIGYVIRSGQGVLMEYVPDQDLQTVAEAPRHLELMRELGCRSCIIAPIRARDKILGAISFMAGEGSRGLGPDDLAVAEELGRRAGLAIENALLYEAAQRAIRARDEFLSIASHELKTPLTSLMLQIQMTRKTTDPERGVMPSPAKLARVLDVAESQVDRLVALVDDLLDVSRIESGKLSFQFEAVELLSLIEDLAERFAEQFKAAGSAISIDALERVIIRCDRFRTEQVVQNLFSNAIKYGAGKPIRVRLEQADGFARIKVSDEGIGIPSDKLQSVFERFERVVAGPGVIGGLGLGLYITREIVKAHKGAIHVQSELGKGSVFTVDLPFAQGT